MNFPQQTSRRSRRTLPLTLLALAANSALLMSPAHAQMEAGYWTFGLGAGQTRSAFDERSLTSRNSSVLPPNAITSQSIATDRRDAGGKVFVGRQFNPYIGMELGYFDLGKFGWQTSTTPAGTLNGEIRAQGLNVDFLATLPLSTNLSALGRVGATYTRTRSEYSSTGILRTLNPSPSERKAEPKWGLGLQYAFNQNFQMRLEGEEYRINDALGSRGKVRMYSASLVIPFGHQAQPMRRAAYVAPAPAPMPARAPEPRVEPTPAPMVMAPPAPAVVAQAPVRAPVAAPVVVPLRRVKYEAESMFEFAASAVRPEGKLALDSFTTDLAGTQYDNITVEGHTDRLGSPEFNQNLSLQRAEAVKEYLVQTRGLSSSKISAVGKGEETPVTKAGDCKGTAQTAKLIACLQPDRRVEIEVSGTR
jgi:OOP family OmpA-OmpF porin